MTTHNYRGQLIKDCSQIGIGGCTGKGWYIQTYHQPTGIQFAEELCAHYPTLVEARRAITDDADYRRNYD